jgi:hypothetical protein
VAAATPEETVDAACEGANGDAAVAKSAKSRYANVSQCAAFNDRVNALVLTGVTGQSRRDGRGASEEAFHEVGHVVDAWGGAEAKQRRKLDESCDVELPQHNRTSGATS